ncbi:hypothetical protein [Shewanella halifaxensis]|uniref:hypothetical protein n=1 Tax=Shewanella halifaxensis TaxID=271098 RepID=UPI000D5A0EA6|nr:hypothetical protein [Shewanella halifaxensis]
MMDKAHKDGIKARFTAAHLILVSSLGGNALQLLNREDLPTLLETAHDALVELRRLVEPDKKESAPVQQTEPKIAKSKPVKKQPSAEQLAAEQAKKEQAQAELDKAEQAATQTTEQLEGDSNTESPSETTEQQESK